MKRVKNKVWLKPTSFLKKKRKGQVWVETVIYTLLAFIMIGLVVSYVKPKVEELRDKAVIEQSSEMMKEIDSTILSMGGAGNQRILEVGIKQGILRINAPSDLLVFEMESKNMYTEPSKKIKDGDVIIYTSEKRGGVYTVNLTLDYSGTSGYNIKFQGEEELKTISQAPTLYKLSILNKGLDDANKVILDIDVD